MPDAAAVAAIAAVEVIIQCEPPSDPAVVALIAALDAYQSELYPPESNHFLDLEALAGADVRFFVARRGSAPVGCGALRVDAGGYGEVKRMYVLPEARGLRIGRMLLVHIEEQARMERLACLRLETGIYQPEALGLYRSAGFVEREPFGDYIPDPLSLFMEKALSG